MSESTASGKIQEISEHLKANIIEPAEKEAEKIIEEAQRKKDEIIAAAEKEAQAITLIALRKRLSRSSIQLKLHCASPAGRLLPR